jgi:hypothetical protein
MCARAIELWSLANPEDHILDSFPYPRKKISSQRSTAFYWLEVIMIIPSYVEYRLLLTALKRDQRYDYLTLFDFAAFVTIKPQIEI